MAGKDSKSQNGQKPNKDEDSEESLSSIASAEKHSILSLRFLYTGRSVPIHVPEHEGVNLTGEFPYFMLILSVTLILAASITLILVSFWAIIWKKNLMMLISVEESDGLLLSAVISAVTATVALSCCCLLCLIHSDSVINKRLLLITIVDLGVILFGLILSVNLSMNYRMTIDIKPLRRSNWRFLPSQNVYHKSILADCGFKSDLNKTLMTAITKYEKPISTMTNVDELQRKLSCCGAESYKDWLKLNQEIPYSCCRKLNESHKCDVNEIFLTGCLHAVGIQSAWWASTMCGYTLILLSFVLETLILVIYLYVDAIYFHRSLRSAALTTEQNEKT